MRNKGREKQAAGQSRAPGRVTWMRCFPRDTVQPMGATLRISNEITFKHHTLRVPVKDSRESGPTACFVESKLKRVLYNFLFR